MSRLAALLRGFRHRVHKKHVEPHLNKRNAADILQKTPRPLRSFVEPKHWKKFVEHAMSEHFKVYTAKIIFYLSVYDSYLFDDLAILLHRIFQHKMQRHVPIWSLFIGRDEADMPTYRRNWYSDCLIG